MKRKKILICFSVLLISSCVINIHAQTESVMIANDIGQNERYQAVYNTYLEVFGIYKFKIYNENLAHLNYLAKMEGASK